MAQITANHYVLAVHNIHECAEWFVRVLGFSVHREPPGWIFVKRDNCMVMLGECTDSTPASQLGDHQYFAYLLVDDADAFHQVAVASGEQLHMPIETKPWGLREFGVATPEGHRIMVGQIV